MIPPSEEVPQLELPAERAGRLWDPGGEKGSPGEGGLHMLIYIAILHIRCIYIIYIYDIGLGIH